MSYDELKSELNAETNALLQQDHVTPEQRSRVNAITTWATSALYSTASDPTLSPAQRDAKANDIKTQAHFEAWQAAKSPMVQRAINGANMTDESYFAAMLKVNR